jgi:alpha-mannosidase
VFATGERLLSEALSELGFDDESLLSPTSKLCTLNTLPWKRSEIVELPSAHPQKYGLAHGDGLSTMSIRPLASAYSAATASIAETSPGTFELRNAQYIVKVTDGVITSLYDIKAERELIPKDKKAAQLVIYDDKPLYWQAWDVEVYHLKSRQELTPNKVYISSCDAAKVSLTIETKISDKSWISTKLSLPAAIGDSPSAIEIEAEIEWQETMKFLKVEFPLDITNTEASYETQYGIVRRPTHYNTSWDMAKFEVCVHKWADLSEATYGVSILNDSKYGFAVAGNVMRLSLVRAPKAPDAHADMGRHHTKYAIFPHAGPLTHATVRKAFEFNNPLRIIGHRAPSTAADLAGQRVDAGKLGVLPTFQIIGADNLVLDTIKRGEDDEDVSRGELPVKKGHSVIVRVYDAMGGKSKAVLSWGDFRVKKVVKTNALEDEEEDLSADIIGAGSGEGNGVKIEVRAFEVGTYKLVFED